MFVWSMVPCSISQADEWQQALACLSEVWKIASGFYLDPEHGPFLLEMIFQAG